MLVILLYRASALLMWYPSTLPCAIHSVRWRRACTVSTLCAVPYVLSLRMLYAMRFLTLA